KVLDVLTKAVVEEDNQRRLKDAQETKTFIDGERKRADDDVKIKEAALALFLSQHPQLAGGEAAPGVAPRAGQRGLASSTRAELAQREMQRAQLEEAIATAMRKPGGGINEIGADPILVATRARAHADLETAQANLAEKQAHFTNEHPDVKSA